MSVLAAREGAADRVPAKAECLSGFWALVVLGSDWQPSTIVSQCSAPELSREVLFSQGRALLQTTMGQFRARPAQRCVFFSSSEDTMFVFSMRRRCPSTANVLETYRWVFMDTNFLPLQLKFHF